MEKDIDFKRKRLLWEVTEDEKLLSLQNKAEMIAKKIIDNASSTSEEELEHEAKKD